MALSKVGGNQIDTVSDGLTVDDDGATVLTVDRATDNGAVIDIQKDGTSVGSVQSRGSAVTSVIFDPRSNGAGITGTTNSIMPTNQSGAIGDGTAVVDLGASGYRYRNLFLSGNIYLGGTGSANALDDYETGTFTITDNSGAGLSITTNVTPGYIKIGNLVFVHFYITYPSNSSGTAASITGFPFSCSGYDYLIGRTGSHSAHDMVWQLNGTAAIPYYNNSARVNSDLNGSYVLLSGSYYTTS